MATLLARELATRSTRLSYRFVFVPSTIGTITWLARNEPELARITHGPEALAGTYAAVLDVIDILEPDGRYRRLNPRGEPQLGRRGLYASVGDGSRREAELALLWVLNGSDGTASLLDIAERPGLPLATVRSAADVLIEHHLVVRVGADLLSATSASSAEPA